MRNAALAVLAVFVFVAGCSGPKSVDDARQKVDVFHNHWNANNYEAIWADSSDEVHRTNDKQDFLRLLTRLHNYYGNVKSTKQIGWYVSTNTNGSFSKVTMETEFDKGRGYEVFLFRNLDGGVQKIEAYNIGKDPPSPSPSASATN